MSNNGNPPQSAPGNAYQQLMLTRPAINADGTLALWLAQWLQRLGGTVGGSTSNSTTSLTDQISEINSTQNTSVGAGSAIDGATQSRIIALEHAARITPLVPMPEVPRPPLAPLGQMPIPASISNALDQVCGPEWGGVLIRGEYGWLTLGPAGSLGLVLCSAGSAASPFWGGASLPGANISISGGTISLNRVGLPDFIPWYVQGTLTTAHEFYAGILGEDRTVPANLAGSYASSDVTATANTTFTLSFGGSPAGSVVFPATSSTGTFASSAGTTASGGSLMKWGPPSINDATLAGVRITTKLLVAA